MRAALIADVHANLVALEAVLNSIREDQPDLVISLGDQVNLGPCPAETMALLRQEGVICLHGNHERYVLSALDGDPAFAGANFDGVRFTGDRLKRSDLEHPWTYTLGNVLFCHSLPEDDAFPIYKPEIAYPHLMDMHPEGVFQIVCGHGHNPTQYTLPHLQVYSIGSAGCMDNGILGAAMYVLADLMPDGCVFRPRFVHYDRQSVWRSFVRSGMHEFCPVLARISCTQMMDNVTLLIPFVKAASQLAKERGDISISREDMERVDASFPWPDDQSTTAFWKTPPR